jgi:hypothetical protein
MAIERFGGIDTLINNAGIYMPFVTGEILHIDGGQSAGH